MNQNMNPVMWSPGMTLDYLEQLVIINAYRWYAKNKTTTANSLGISIRTLDNKLAKYEIEAKALAEKTDDERRSREDYLRRARGISTDTPPAPSIGPSGGAGLHASSGLRVEPPKDPTAKSYMSVPKRA